MKMYILVRNSVPLGFAMVGVAHASLATFLKFREAPDVAAWLSGPFKKAVCRVTDAEFAAAKDAGDCVVITEAALDGAEVALGFRPRELWPRSFAFFPLYK